MKLPGDWLDSAMTVGKFSTLLETPTAEKIVEAINTLQGGALSVEEFDLIAQGAGLNLPVLSIFKAAMTSSQNGEVPKELKGKEIGEWFKKNILN